MRPAAKVAMSGICTAAERAAAVFRRCGAGAGLCMSCLTGVLMVVLVRTFGYGTAWITYVSTGLLSFFLVPDKECMLMYVLFFGYYTIVRQWIGRLRPRSVALAAECLLFNAALAAVNLLLVYVFAIPMDAVSSNKWFLVGFWLAMNLLFFLYERLLGVAELLYVRKIEKRLRSVFKK